MKKKKDPHLHFPKKHLRHKLFFFKYFAFNLIFVLK